MSARVAAAAAVAPQVHQSPAKQKQMQQLVDRDEIQLSPLKHSRLCPNTLNIIDSPSGTEAEAETSTTTLDSSRKILAAFDQSMMLETQSAPTTPVNNIKPPLFMLTATAKPVGGGSGGGVNKSDTNNNLSSSATGADDGSSNRSKPMVASDVSDVSGSSGGVVSPLAMINGIFGGCLKPMFSYWAKTNGAKPALDKDKDTGATEFKDVFECVNPSGDASTSGRDQTAVLGNLQNKWMARQLTTAAQQQKQTGAATAAAGVKTDSWVIPLDLINISELIGSGSHGTVFLAELNGEKVALKKVREEAETRIDHLRRLSHRNIIKLKGICSQAPWYCIIMEYCAQGQLYEVLRRPSVSIGPVLMIDWAKQVADGMAYLHQYNTIHRDLKSLNILVDERNIVKISDFDTCRTWNQQSSAHMSFCGTAAWMAPEMIHNEPRSNKVDVWSYGVVLWELITRQIPYYEFDSPSIMLGVGNGTLSLPVPEQMPEGLKLLLRQCWSVKPRNRPSFPHIMRHLEIALAEVKPYSTPEWEGLQSIWAESINNHFNNLRTHRQPGVDKDHHSAFSQAEDELLRRRRDELAHAKDVRKLYEDKLRRVTELDRQLMDFMYHYDQQKRELDHRERAFVQILRSYGFPNQSNHRPSHSRPRSHRPQQQQHRIAKQMVTRAGPKMLAGYTDQAANTDVCSTVTNQATMQQQPQPQPTVHVPQHRLDVASSSDEDDAASHVATVQSSSSGLSPLCAAQQLDALGGGGGSGRRSGRKHSSSTITNANSGSAPSTSRRGSVNCRASPARLSDRFSRDSSARGSGCSTGRSEPHYSGLWARASPYRVSGSSAISADSGVHGMMSPTDSVMDVHHWQREDSSCELSGGFTRNSCRHSSLTQPRLYRNEAGRWSDGRIRQLHQAQPLCRNEPTRNAVPRHRRSHGSSRSHSRHNLSSLAVNAAEHKVKRHGVSPGGKSSSSSRGGSGRKGSSPGSLQDAVVAAAGAASNDVNDARSRSNGNTPRANGQQQQQQPKSSSDCCLQPHSAEVCLGCQGECSDPSCQYRQNAKQQLVDANCNPLPPPPTRLTHSSSYQEALKTGHHQHGSSTFSGHPKSAGSDRNSPNMVARYRHLVHNAVHSDPDMRGYSGRDGWHCHSDASDDDSLSSNTESEKENDMDSSLNMSDSLTASTLRRDILAATTSSEHQDAMAHRHTPSVMFRAQQPITSEDENTSERSSRESTGLTGLLNSSMAAAMVSSESTMASSLERSLELAALHSDGLSDKECRVRAVRQIIGHRRTNSQPVTGLPIPALITESTTSDSDCDVHHHPVHC